MEEIKTGIVFEIAKYEDEEGLCSGWANVSMDIYDTPVFDWHGDVIHPNELERAAIAFMMDYRASGVMHEGSTVASVVESIVLTKEKQAAIGIPPGTVPQGWFITVKVDDPALREDIKTGKYRMFSIQGRGQRTAI